jgi:hypothetical protein
MNKIAAGIIGIMGLTLFLYYSFLINYLNTMKQYDDKVSEQNKKTREIAFIVTIFVIVMYSVFVLLKISTIFNMEVQFMSLLALGIIVMVFVYYGFLIKYLSDMKEYDREVGTVNENTRKTAFGYTITVIILLVISIYYYTIKEENKFQALMSLPKF